MPRQIDARDFLYRKVNPEGWDASGVLVDAFQDKYENLSFSLASRVSPREVLEKFAKYKSVKARCGTEDEPDAKQMFKAGYRIAVISVLLVPVSGFIFEVDDSGNEDNESDHVNIIAGKNGAVVWSVNAHLLTELEMERNTLSLPPSL